MRRKSFTLIETMIAIFVLIIGILAVIHIFPLSLGITNFSKMKSVSLELCQEKIEEIISLSYQDVLTGTVNEENLSPPFEKYSRITEIIYLDSNLEQTENDFGFKKITVTVNFQMPFKILKKEAKLIEIISQK